MKIGVMNYPKFDLIKEIKWIGENGFDYIDLTIEPLKAYNFDIKEVKKALADFNLETVGHTNPFLPSILPLQSIREVCLDEFRKYVDIFSRLGITLMNIHTYYHAPFLSEEEIVMENIRFIEQVNVFCKAKGIALMLENSVGSFGTPEFFTRITEEIPDLRINLDIGHCNINHTYQDHIKNLTEDFFRRFRDRIVHLHLSDNKGKRDDHLPLGCGNIGWKRTIEVIKRSGYDRTMTLEVFSPDRDYLLMSRNKLKDWWENTRLD